MLRRERQHAEHGWSQKANSDHQDYSFHTESDLFFCCIPPSGVWQQGEIGGRQQIEQSQNRRLGIGSKIRGTRN